MTNSKVSILMATYNGARFLDEQLQSILNQTHQNLEIIIQDDGSTDNTMEILRRYQAEDARIQIHQNIKNLGINANFYSLIEKSTGDYIAISDQDDVWLLDKIEVLLNSIGNASLIYTDSALIDAKGKALGYTLLERFRHTPKHGEFLTDLFDVNTISGHACLFDHHLKRPIEESVSVGFGEQGVFDMLIGTIASFKNGVIYHENPLTLHRIHELNNQNKVSIQAQDSIGFTPSNERKSRGATFWKQSFWRHKYLRVNSKINRAKIFRKHLKHLFSMFYEDHLNPFMTASTSDKKETIRIFNFKLYRALLNANISRKDAKKVCSGKILFYLTRFF